MPLPGLFFCFSSSHLYTVILSAKFVFPELPSQLGNETPAAQITEHLYKTSQPNVLKKYLFIQ